MNLWRYKLISFMSGRYGNDKLNNALLCLYFVVWIIKIFIRHYIATMIMNTIQLLILFIIIARMFSRNIYKRRAENDRFIRTFGKLLPDFSLIKNKIRDRDTHIYKKCPQCKSILRLKKISGDHTAVCPKCKNKFKVKVKWG